MTGQSRRLLLWGCLGLVLAAGLAYALWPRPVPVDFIVAARGPLVVTVDEEGETRIRDIFVLSAPIAGRMRRIDLDVGDTVIAGESEVALIEPIDPAFLDLRSEAQAEAVVDAAEANRRLAAAEVDSAQAELDFARSELYRAQELIGHQHISERALDDAERKARTRQAALETAKAGLRMRESELRHARSQLLSPADATRDVADCDCVALRAPVSGRILRIINESEGVVQPGAPLIEIGDPQDLEIVVDYLSEDAVKIEANQRVIIEEWGGGADLAGRVDRVEPFGFTKVSALGIEEQRVNVIIDFTDAPVAWQRLGHGFRVETRVVLWQGDDVLKLPLTALFRNGEDWSVFVEEDGRARQRRVTLGQRTGFEAEIVEGLEPGERVVLHPSDRVVDGVGLAARS